jgi:Protein of unknown function (DUF3800)
VRLATAIIRRLIGGLGYCIAAISASLERPVFKAVIQRRKADPHRGRIAIVPERPFVIIDVYMDESGTHDSSEMMTIGGLVGRPNHWHYFDRRWAKMLKKRSIPYFHTKSLLDTHKPFKGWTRAQKAELINRAGDIQQKQTMFGFSTALRRSDYEEFYKSGERPKKIPLDSLYGLCFRYCATWLPSILEASLGTKDFEINFIMEAGHKNAGDALRVFNQIKNEADNPAIFKSLTFRNKESLGLQGADYVAHATWLVESEPGVESHLTDFPKDGDLSDAKRILGRKPVFRGSISPDLLRQIKANTMAEDARRLEFGRRKSQSEGSAVAAE